MSLVVAAIAVFPFLAVLMVGLAKTENVLFTVALPGSTPAEPPTTAPIPVQDVAVQ
jgi:hypothetical protein